MTASLGVAGFPNGDCTAEEVLQRTSQALREAKTSGRNSVTRFGEHDAESKEWGNLVASGKMFEQVVARDIMTPCTLLLHMDHALRRAAALIRQTGLPAMAVVDANGKLVGLVTEGDVSRGSARDEPRRFACERHGDGPGRARRERGFRRSARNTDQRRQVPGGGRLQRQADGPDHVGQPGLAGSSAKRKFCPDGILVHFEQVPDRSRSVPAGRRRSADRCI